MLTCADPDTAGEGALAAVTVTVFVDGTLDGGVYTPALEIVPTVLLPPVTPFTSQLTAVLLKLLTVAVKASVLPSRTWLLPVTVIEGCDDEFPPPPPEPQPLSRRAAPRAKTGIHHRRGSDERRTIDLRKWRVVRRMFLHPAAPSPIDVATGAVALNKTKMPNNYEKWRRTSDLGETLPCTNINSAMRKSCAGCKIFASERLK